MYLIIYNESRSYPSKFGILPCKRRTFLSIGNCGTSRSVRGIRIPDPAELQCGNSDIIRERSHLSIGMAAAGGNPGGESTPSAEFNPFAGRSLRVAVGLDGSKIAKHTADVVLSLLGSHAPSDKVDVLTITDASKSYLPYDMRPSTISDWAEVHFVSRLPRK